MNFQASLQSGFALVVCLLATRATVRAMSEFCPASSPTFRQVGDGSSPLYEFSVFGKGPRAVSGTIVVKTNTAWFSVPFTTELVGRKENIVGQYVEYTTALFSSAPMYARFPYAVHIAGAFVSDARSTGDPYFGWDSQGDVRCSAPSGFGSGGGVPLKTVANLPAPSPTRSPIPVMPPPPGATIRVASITSIPGSTDCAEPFRNAEMKDVARPDFPQSLARSNASGVVLVEVVVDASGNLADEWVFAPSPYKELDASALEAAKHSTYRAGTAFCKPAPGEYLFRAQFNP